MDHARNDVTPVEGLDVQSGLLLAMLDMATAEWREEMGAVPDEVVCRQSYPRGQSIGALILHMATVESAWITGVAAGRERSEEELKTLLSREIDPDGPEWPAPPAQPLSWFLAQHDAVRARTRQIVAELQDPERLGYSAHRPGREFTLRWLLAHVILHEAYHGGQAVLLAIQHGAG
ncbi:MAG TPA: DinB family protein [Armatimonadota bacterium]|jgi:uncharacterized damage-inducible protein DinB